jgi:virginiamycin A acetyltransferase
MSTLQHGPSAEETYPMTGQKRVCYIKNLIDNPNILIGDYTYYDHPTSPETFVENVLYHFDFIGDKLIIGKFCAIASGVKFIMNGANHNLNSVSTYPFGAFGKGWESGLPALQNIRSKGDTIIGNDVWLGFEAVIMPGITIGDGAIIAAKSVVTKNVAPYSIVGGNPAREIRKRFSAEQIEQLLALQWWNWPIEKITQRIPALCESDIDALLTD